nr:RecName: Full=Glycerotoxin paralog 1; Short=GLTx paralog 1 [Glycera tridactyla]
GGCYQSCEPHTLKCGSVSFEAKCKSGWSCYPVTDNIASNACDRFKSCQDRWATVKETDAPCTSCVPGFQLTSRGYCSQDLNECNRNNGGCTNGKCINTEGSYHCDCDRGYLATSSRTKCEGVECEPLTLANGKVQSNKGSWIFGSRALFTCDDQARSVLDGPSYITCNLDAAGLTASWSGTSPTCQNDDEHDRFAEVFHLRFHGKKLDGVSLVTGLSPRSTAYRCHKDSTCQGIMTRAEEFEVSATGLTVYDGGVLTKTLGQSRADGDALTDDASMDIYTKVDVSSAAASSYQDVLDAMVGTSLGCYTTSSMASWEDYTLDDGRATTCNQICLQAGYDYFGIQASDKCWCGQKPPVEKVGDGECSTVCVNQANILCGSATTANIYQVYRDRSLGFCYTGNLGTETVPSAKTKDECVTVCRGQGYYTANIRNSGECFCDNSLPGGPRVDPTKCDEDGSGHSTVYMTNPAYFMSNDQGAQINPMTTRMYDDTGSVTGMTTGLFQRLPGLRIFTSDRLVLYSAEEVQFHDVQNDYADTCGEIKRIDGESDRSGDLILHFFHFRLSQLAKHTSDRASRVYIYAQKVVIDCDIQVQFSLMIRATKIVVSTGKVFKILVGSESSQIEMDVDDVKNNGPPRNLQQMKDSLQCARMLAQSWDDTEKQKLAFNILHEMTSPTAGNEAQRSVQTMASALKLQLEGMFKNDIHHVPSYSAAYFTYLMKADSDIVNAYAARLNALEVITTSRDDFLNYTQELEKIHQDTSIAQAKKRFDETMKLYKKEDLVYTKLQAAYDTALTNLRGVIPTFRKSIEAQEDHLRFKALLSFLELGVAAMDPAAVASVSKGFYDDVTDIAASSIWGIDQVVTNIDSFTDVMTNNLNEMMSEVKPYDGTKYAYEIEKVANMHVFVEEWRNFQVEVNNILGDDTVSALGGAGDYGRNLVKLTNIGMALTNAMINRAEKTRDAAQKRTTWDLLVEQGRRTTEVIKGFKAANSERAAANSVVAEQIRDITSEINGDLANFCEAYFFEKLEPCPKSTQPRFGGDLLSVQLSISRAEREAASLGLDGSPVSREVTITNTDASEDCIDVTQCPVTVFKRDRAFSYEVPIDNFDLSDWDKYRVKEIEVKAIGATPDRTETDLKLFVRSSGSFSGKSGGTHYNFLTDDFFCVYEYDINSPIDAPPESASGRCTVYARGSKKDMTRYATPYAAWMIEVD